MEIERLLTDSIEKLSLKGDKEIAGSGAVMNPIRVLEHGPAFMLKLPKQERGGGVFGTLRLRHVFFLNWAYLQRMEQEGNWT